MRTRAGVLADSGFQEQPSWPNDRFGSILRTFGISPRLDHEKSTLPLSGYFGGLRLDARGKAVAGLGERTGKPLDKLGPVPDLVIPDLEWLAEALGAYSS